MGAEHAGQLAGLALGPVEAAGHKKTGHTLKIDLLDRVILALHLAMDHRMQRRFLRERPQPQRDRQLAAHAFGAHRPGLARGGRLKRKIAVQVLQRLESPVVGQLAFGQNPPRRERGGIGAP